MLSKIELRLGYRQVRVKEEDIYNIGFQTRYGCYEFVVVPFGLTNSPTIVMCLMNSVFHPYLNKFVIIFIDDILICSKNEEEHDEHLETVSRFLREHQLYAGKILRTPPKFTCIINGIISMVHRKNGRQFYQ